MTHLIQNGHYRIAMLAYKNSLHHTQERKRGYLQALKDHQLPAKKQWLLEVKFEDLVNDVERLLDTILLPEPAVDAIFFSTNSLAVQGLKQIKKLNITVPDKVAVISFDETDAFDFCYSPVTYVKQDILTIGKKAVAALLHQMRNEAKPEKGVEVEAELVVRESRGGKTTKRTA